MLSLTLGNRNLAADPSIDLANGAKPLHEHMGHPEKPPGSKICINPE